MMLTGKQYDQVMKQLPAGARITKIYTAFENGETRLVVKYAGEDRENRYVVHDEDGCPRITLKP